MVFATVIIVMVFVPLAVPAGARGPLLPGHFALTYMVSILASLVVALTVVPAMCRFLLKGRLGGEHADREGWLVRVLKRAYEPSLRPGHPATGLWVLGTGGAS